MKARSPESLERSTVTEQMKLKAPYRAVNFLHIYAYCLLILASVLNFLGLNADNALPVVIFLGLAAGVGINIIDEENTAFSTKYYSIREAMWLAVVAPLEIRKLKFRK